MEIYTSIFEQQNALDKLEAFASFNGADFYGLPRNNKTITLKKQAWTIPDEYPMANDRLVPFLSGQTIDWQLMDSNEQ